MDFIILIAATVVAVLLGFFLLFALGFGLIIALVLLLIAAIIGGAWLISTGGWSSVTQLPLLGLVATWFTDYSDATEIPDQFIECIYEQPVKMCRTGYTTWQEDKEPFLLDMQERMKNRLGAKNASSHWQIHITTDAQGKIISVQRTTEYEKSSSVLEEFSLVKQDDQYLIRDFSINF